MARLSIPPEGAKVNPFQFPTYAPGVLPTGYQFPRHGTKLAMDDALAPVTAAWGWGVSLHGTWAEGIGFMGYPYLAELTQRSEYRQPSQVIAEEMTRKWITLKSTGDDDKTDKIKALTEALDEFKLRETFRAAIELEGFMGLSMLYPDLEINGNLARDDPEELKTPLLITNKKIGRYSLKGFRIIDPTWVAPTQYNSNNPLDPTFYKPQIWFVMGTQVHVSRLFIFNSRPLPDMLKPAYNFGGMSLSQMLKPYVDNWLRTRQSVSDLLNAFTVWKLSTNLMATVMGGDDTGMDGGDQMDLRLSLFTAMKNNRGVLAIDKDSEDLDNISAPLGSLDKLQAQAQEQMASPARIPLVKLFGITPSGLNASTDGEIRSFYDSMLGLQERMCREPIKRALDIIQLSIFGMIDPEITFGFNPLWQLDDAGEAAVRKTDADTDAVYINAGVLAPEDVRTKIAGDPTSRYEGLDGEAPGLADPGSSDLDDPSERVDNLGEEGSTEGANSGV